MIFYYITTPYFIIVIIKTRLFVFMSKFYIIKLDYIIFIFIMILLNILYTNICN